MAPAEACTLRSIPHIVTLESTRLGAWPWHGLVEAAASTAAPPIAFAVSAVGGRRRHRGRG